MMNGRLDARECKGDMATDNGAAFNGLRCDVCSGRLHVVDRVGPILECEDCGRKGIWDDHEKRVSYSPSAA
jgi:hypothetical protein